MNHPQTVERSILVNTVYIAFSIADDIENPRKNKK